MGWASSPVTTSGRSASLLVGEVASGALPIPDADSSASGCAACTSIDVGEAATLFGAEAVHEAHRNQKTEKDNLEAKQGHQQAHLRAEPVQVLT